MQSALLETFSDAGVSRIEYVAAFPDLEGACVWLGTTTDAERDALSGTQLKALSQVRQVAARHGFPPEQINGIRVQSEETVVRDYEGSWFYALR